MGEVDALQDVYHLTNLNDVNRLLHETLIREQCIDAELETLQSKRESIDRSLLTLQQSTVELLEVAKEDAEELASSVRNTSALSERVSRKVRELDLAQSRIHDVLDRIRTLTDRTNAVDGVQQAMATEDHEAAAGYVKRYLDLQARLGQPEPGVAGQGEEQDRVLLAAREQLRQVVAAKLAEAEKQGDHTTVLRYTKLYAPLGYPEEGLAWLTAYLRRAVAERAKEEHTALVESTSGKLSQETVDFVGALTNVLQDVGTCVAQTEPYLAEHFGRGSLLALVEGLAQESDEHATRLLQRYVRARKLDALVSDITSFKRAAAPNGRGPVDPRQVEGYLEEMLMLCQRAEEYNQFQLGRMAAAVAPNPVAPAQENAFRSSPFNMVVRELIAYYISLEEFYMEQNVEKAIEIDEWSADTLTTSMVDDAFFVLQKCGRRALATGNLQCVCAVLAQLNALLATCLRSALDARWKGAAARLLQGLAAAAAGEGLSTATPSGEDAQAASAANNADMSALYTAKLRSQLEELTAELFEAPHDKDRIKSVLADLSKTASDFAAITQRAVDHLANGVMPQLRLALEEAAGTSYELSEADYEGLEVAVTWVDRLLGSLAATLQWFQPLLTAAAFDRLVASLLEKVVDRIEAIMHVKAYNQLGGLQLDRNVRALVATLSDITQKTVRDKFSRLSQMSTLLSLESVMELLDYWGDNAEFNWRFSEAQVREVLCQRVDFNRQDVALLSL